MSNLQLTVSAPSDIVSDIVVRTEGKDITPFIPLIAVVTMVIDEVIEVYGNSLYNKKICDALMERVQIADSVIKTLNRKNEKFFHNQDYYKDFVRFINVMERIGDFMTNYKVLKNTQWLVLLKSNFTI